ncbi:DUF3515 family protein [Nocardioides sp. GY 10127]|uniref:DUF3515 family protein n=1 Tax=Nocardioides sp. GY 10127 TaxID=2569762 RepID=UPI0010A91CF3|nr:DUF3515 family protein [Nocardioides sp. GY 10127]TIC80822.1 DUF3515 family protein [Nocardioides sp. GY 10127]
MPPRVTAAPVRPRRALAARVAAAVLALPLALTGCTAEDATTTATDVPGRVDLSPAAQQRCDDLLTGLGDELGGLALDGDVDLDAGTATFGEDDPVTVVCGTAAPDELALTSSCQDVRGVGWFIPDEQLADSSVDAVATAVGFRPRLSVVVPAARRGSDSLAVLSALAGPVKRELRLVHRCK